MEDIYDMINMEEDVRKDLRKRLVGITPSMLAKIGRYPSIVKLTELTFLYWLQLVLLFAP